MTQWNEHSDESLIEYAANHRDFSAPASMEMQRRLMVAIKHFDDESARYSNRMLRLTKATIGLTVVVGLIALLQLWASVWPPRARPDVSNPVLTTQTTGTAEARIGEHTIEVPGRAVHLPASRWKPMQNEFEWAANFEDTSKDASQEVGRVVTIFKLPMSDDRRNGVRISAEEYLEMFVVRPGTLTVQVRVDRGRYWLLSRETLIADTGKAASLPVGALLTGPSFEAVRLQFQTQIDATRYVLQSNF